MRFIVPLVLSLILAGCGGPQPPSGPPLVVFASADDPSNLLPLFTAFTAETGIPITASWRDSAANTDALIEQQGPPADVLISTNVADIWRAGDQGALRPLRGDAFLSVPEQLRDPDGFWVALQRRVAVIAIAPNNQSRASDRYEGLARPAYRGKLCLSSVGNSINRALIAMLIEDLGLKPAERAVRGWVMNLPVPPLATEALLLAALESGTCQFGIISSTANTSGMRTISPDPLYAEISAMGVGRHAENPQQARELIDWLILNKPLEGLAESTGGHIGVAGWRDEDARLLAERAGYK